MSTNTLNTFNLSGRIALVTGASKGMGRSIAAILAQAGARVVISSRKQADCDRVATEISPEPGQCIGIASNIEDSETLQALVAATQAKVGKPDILVCNAAGEAPIGSLDKVEAAVFDGAMISNVRNNLLLANMVAPDMVARRDGSIIIMSSIVGDRGRRLFYHKGCGQPIGSNHDRRMGSLPGKDERDRPDRRAHRFLAHALGHSRCIGSRDRTRADGTSRRSRRRRWSSSPVGIARGILHQWTNHRCGWRSQCLVIAP